MSQVVIHVSGGNADVVSNTDNVSVHILDFDNYHDYGNMVSSNVHLQCIHCRIPSAIFEWNAVDVYLNGDGTKRIHDDLVDISSAAESYACPRCFKFSRVFELTSTSGKYSSIKEKMLDIQGMRKHVLDLWHDYTKSLRVTMKEVLPNVQVYDRYYVCFPNLHNGQGVGGKSTDLVLAFDDSDHSLSFTIKTSSYRSSHTNRTKLGESHALGKPDAEWIVIFDHAIREFMEKAAMQAVK